MADGLSPRDTRSDIYDLMKAVFLGGDPAEARRRAMEVDEDPGMVLMWIDENMPTECTDTGDLIRGYEKLSRADIFMSRVGSIPPIMEIRRGNMLLSSLISISPVGGGDIDSSDVIPLPAIEGAR